MMTVNEIRARMSQFINTRSHYIHDFSQQTQPTDELIEWFQTDLSDEVCQIANEIIRDVAEHVSNYFPNEESKSSTVVRDIVLKIILNYSL